MVGPTYVSANRDKMTIHLSYDGDHVGGIWINSPVGRKNKLRWKIGSAILLFGGWIMFGRQKEWITKTYG